MAAHDAEITIKVLDDHRAAVRLARLDSAPTLEGRLLGAIAAGRLIAAVSLDTGRSVADPFVPSAHARAMLEQRAAQLNGAGNGGRARRLFGKRRRRARAALSASPPGAGGRLLALPGEADQRR